MKKLFRAKGFTLVEVLLVVVIIAILAAVVIVAINPGRQISQANDTQRRSDVQTILNAVHQYSIDHRGQLPGDIPEGEANANYVGSGAVDLHEDLVPTYIAEMPYDPTYEDETLGEARYESETEYFTGYEIFQEDGRVTVSAPGAELEEEISVTR